MTDGLMDREIEMRVRAEGEEEWESEWISFEEIEEYFVRQIQRRQRRDARKLGKRGAGDD